MVQQYLCPVAAVERAVLDGFGQMGDGQVLGAFEVGDGAGHFEDAIVRARGEALLLHGALQQALGIGAQFAVGANLARGHLRVGVDFFAGLSEALPLALARGHHAVANLRRALGRRSAAQLLVLHGRNFDMNIDAVEQRAGDFGHVALDHGRRTHALARLVVEVAAGAGIHGGGQHEARRKAERHGGARDGDV
jgi:hypothetical protein